MATQKIETNIMKLLFATHTVFCQFISKQNLYKASHRVAYLHSLQLFVYAALMFLQTAGLAEAFVAQWTLVRLLSRVDSHVNVQSTRQSERLLTPVTFVWFHSSVNSAVFSEVIWRWESFATNCTLIRFVSCVDCHMTMQQSTVSKRLATHMTFVQSNFTMNSTVLQKVIGSRKPFVANGTFERSLTWMTPHVYCKLITVLTTLATFCTLEFTGDQERPLM